MGRNHLETGRKRGDAKGASTTFMGSGPRLWQGCGRFPEKSEAWTPNWAPKHRGLVLGSPAHAASSDERLWGFAGLRETESSGDNATFFFPLTFVLRGPWTGFTLAATHLGFG